MEHSSASASQGMEDNLKKAVTEMLVLALLARADMYAAQITQELERQSGGALSIVFPYAALYRLIASGYIWEAYKMSAPDGRRRQYYQITDLGRSHLAELTDLYRRFTAGTFLLLNQEEDAHGE